MTAAAVEILAPHGETLEVGFFGFVHGVSLVDLLQIFHYARRTLTLHVEPNAAIHVSEGEIVHATVGDIEGELAISTLLRRTGGRIRTAGPMKVSRTVERPFNFLLLDSLREMDEASQDEVHEWPEESGAFAKTATSRPRGSRFPSIPAVGNDLLTTACVQLRERVEGSRGAQVFDLEGGRALAHFGQVERNILSDETKKAFDRPALGNFESQLFGDAESTFVSELRFTGERGSYFAKATAARKTAMVLCVLGNESPGLAWAELRQSASLLERLP